ncbi:MAG: type II toxin-antitoxin system HigB family toxin, partial [Desulfococcaceae bacterium]
MEKSICFRVNRFFPSHPIQNALDPGIFRQKKDDSSLSGIGNFFHFPKPRATEPLVHVISRKLFRDAAQKFPNDAAKIDAMYKTLRNGFFPDPDTLRAVFPSLDNFKYKKKWWVLNIGGNNLRLIAFIDFRDNRMYVKHIVSHAEYDRLCVRY